MANLFLYSYFYIRNSLFKYRSSKILHTASIINFKIMLIDESILEDSSMTSPHMLFNTLGKQYQTLGTSPNFNHQILIKEHIRDLFKNTTLSQTSNCEENRKKKENNSLKKIINKQKIENIKRNFMTKIKYNNINSTPLQFQPYKQKQIHSFLDRKGLQISDCAQKFISIIIIITILLSTLIQTTYLAFPQIYSNNLIRYFLKLSLLIFVAQFLSNLFIVKLVEGKKIFKIKKIIINYFQDGMVMDFAYLVVLLVDLIGDSGWFRLVILLKLPQCFSRIQKIENSVINTFYKEQYWGLAKVFLLNFSFSHILCILVILMSHLDENKSWMVQKGIQNAPWQEQYVWAFYWGTTIMLTVGFGDIAPANHKQAICIVMIETFSCLCLAYNINCVGNLITNIKSQDIEKNRNIKTFKILSNRNNLTENLQMKIHNYIQESTNIKKKFNFQEQSNFISTLPRQLKAQFLKQSNKRIFEGLTFFRNLTQKTLLNFAQVIQMKICHPEQIIKKRGQVSGVMILKEGRIALSTKLTGSDFSNTRIQGIQVKDNTTPYLLSLDFISNDRIIYEMKSQQYSVLYYLDRQKTIQVLKTSQLDYEHFCFLRDKSRNLQTDFEVFNCQQCKLNHTKFECPKLHFCPLKKHVIDRYLHKFKTSKSYRQRYTRQKSIFNPFVQLSNNENLFNLNNKQIKYGDKFSTYKSKKRQNSIKVKQQLNDQSSNIITRINSDHSIIGESSYKFTTKQLQTRKRLLNTVKKIQYQVVAEYIKDQIQKLMLNRCEVWLIQTDQIKNFKFYFNSYNPSTLEYLQRKYDKNSMFG